MSNLAPLLNEHMDAMQIKSHRLIKLVNSRFPTMHLSRSSVENWRQGTSRRIRDLRTALALAATLHLDEAQTNAFMNAAGHCLTLADIKKQDDPKINPFLAFWNVEESVPISQDSPTRFALPIDVMPAPSRHLPAHSRMVYLRNPLFVGRADLLQQLAIMFDNHIDDGTVPLAIMTGIGGVGKTQLAVEFCYRYGRYFTGGVFWLSFAQPSLVLEEIIECGHHLMLPNFAQLDLTSQLKQVQATWQEPNPRLLIFDNCEDETLLNRWLPRLGGCRVLITSRRAHWSAHLHAQILQVAPFIAEESSLLLQQLAKSLTKETAVAISHQLGHLPLALHLAGSFLDTYERLVSPQQYLQQLQTNNRLTHPSLIGQSGAQSPTTHVQNINYTICRSYDQLASNTPIDQMARQLLLRASQLIPHQPIPMAFLLDTAAEDDLTKTMLMQDGLTRLQQIGLIYEQREEHYILHPLVQDFVQTLAVSQSDRGDVLTDVTNLIVNYCRPLLEAHEIARLRPYIHHIQLITDIALEKHIEHEASLSYCLASYYLFMQQHDRAITYFEHSLAAHLRIYGNTSSETVLILVRLGYLTLLQHNYTCSAQYLQQAMDIIQQEPNKFELHMVEVNNVFGHLFVKTGDLPQALDHMQKSVELCCTLLGENNVGVVLGLMNLGTVQQKMGAMNEAEETFRRSWMMWQTLDRGESPQAGRILSCWGSLYLQTNKLSLAQDYLKQAINILDIAAGKSHPWYIDALHLLAQVTEQLGKHSLAIDYYTACVDGYANGYTTLLSEPDQARGDLARVRASISGYI